MSFTLAIDPGPTESQFLMWDGRTVIEMRYLPNNEVRDYIHRNDVQTTKVCIEMIASYGMAVGREVFDTCLWIGRFDEHCRAHHFSCTLIFRQTVKLHLCNSPRAKDANIRQALIDRFGGKDAAIGRKAAPGPLYGVSSHAWAALALAITFADAQANVTAV